MRLVGTAIGLVYGALLWYISCGKAARGNAYGLAAATAVGFVPLIFIRIWSPMVLWLPSIMLNVSVVLIVGYSWIDTHYPVTANSGIGIGLAWKRALLVVIGIFVALIIMVFPRPVSSRHLLRKNMAKVTRQINDVFIEIMETWIARNQIHERMANRAGFANRIDAENNHDEQVKDSSPDAILELWREREPLLRARFMSLNSNIATYSSQIALATSDFQIRGRWPQERYAEIATVHATILEALGAITSSIRAFDGIATTTEGSTTISPSSSGQLNEGEKDWQLTLLYSTSLLDPQYLSEICTMFDLLSKSLRNGERLNHASFSLLENHFKYALRNRKVEAYLRKKQAGQDGNSPGELLTEGEDMLSWKVLRDPMYLRYITARMASITLATELDKLKAIVHDLVGESSLRGFDMLKEKSDERMYRALKADDA